MATIEIGLNTLLLTANASIGIAIAYLLATRKKSLITRNINLKTTSFKAENLEPNDLVIVSMPDASERKIEQVREDLRNLGMVNAVVVNKEIAQFKKDKVNLEPTEDMRAGN